MQRVAAGELVQWLEGELTRSGIEAPLSLRSSGPVADSLVLACEVELSRYWLDGAGSDTFKLSVEFDSQASELAARAVTFSPLPSPADAGGGQPVRVRLDRPLLLDTVHIPKPWGQEIWYTGVEARGVCGVRGDDGVVPLPWLLDTLGALLTGGHRELVLLKILDPLPQQVWGDLYFELHEEKQEVYVVTNVDATAWPDGVGAIRFGFDPGKLEQYPDEAAFKQAFRESVAAYESVRREIDAGLDERRAEHGIALDAALEPEHLEAWQSELPVELLARERELRGAMEAFSRFLPLRVGDVVKVPCFTPHSLQHGVRTVEFQTPVYERKILSFAQKVLTQGHWDTDDAVALMQLRAADQAPFDVVRQNASVVIERIVDFDDFEVQRWRVQPGPGDRLHHESAYALVMAVDGAVSVGQSRLEPEQACLVSKALGAVDLVNEADAVSTVLVALPKDAESVAV